MVAELCASERQSFEAAISSAQDLHRLLQVTQIRRLDERFGP